MGISRTAAARLLALLALFPIVTYADDAGPGKEVGAIRHDLATLTKRPMLADPATPVKIEDVVVDGDDALASWSDASGAGIYRLQRRLHRWWLVANVFIEKDGSAICCGGMMSPIDPFGPTVGFLERTVHVSAPLAQAAAVHISVVRSADARAARSTSAFYVTGHGDGYVVSAIPFDRASHVPSETGAYALRIAFAANDAPQTARLARISGRAPTEAESWLAPDGNSYFFFYGSVESASPIRIRAGTRIDVWFPFVLDSTLTYSLTIAHADRPIGPIDGTLRDNILHFELPAFTLLPGSELFGEIEGE